jgi:hypothetical protein
LIANRRAIVKCSCQVHTEEPGARTEQSEEAEFEAIRFECVELDAVTLAKAAELETAGAFKCAAKFVLQLKLRRRVQGLSRVRRLSLRLFSSNVLSMMLLLWQRLQIWRRL